MGDSLQRPRFSRRHDVYENLSSRPHPSPRRSVAQFPCVMLSCDSCLCRTDDDPLKDSEGLRHHAGAFMKTLGEAISYVVALPPLFLLSATNLLLQSRVVCAHSGRAGLGC
eukprot:3141074-Rhodomonas_salina.2